MEKSKEPAEQLRIFAQYLRREERSRGTVEKYLRDVMWKTVPRHLIARKEQLFLRL